jgi:ABC-type uncharacterized transport system substrate-binding protein
MLDVSSLSLALLDPGAALSHACYSQSFYVDIRYDMPDPNDLLSETKIETKLQRALMKHNLQRMLPLHMQVPIYKQTCLMLALSGL